MKNELIEFITKNSEVIEYILEDAKLVLNKSRSKDDKSVILLNILHEILKDNEEKLKDFLFHISKILDENKLSALTNFIVEEKINIIDYFMTIENEKRESYPKLTDFEWKFVGLTTPDKLETGEIIPKIILRLFFNNGSNKIIETDFSNLRKLLDEFEYNASSLNSTYVRRIDSFLK